MVLEAIGGLEEHINLKTNEDMTKKYGGLRRRALAVKNGEIA
jgi:hypothetical protein